MAFFQRIPFVALVAVSFSITFEVFYYIIQKWNKNKNKLSITATPNEEINEVIFFPDTSVVTSSENGFDQNGSSSLCRLMQHLSNTERTLDLCLYIFSCSTLCKVVGKVHRNGARVRLIIDDSQTETSGSQIAALRSRGIWVRSSKSTPYLMHHKFVIVDGKLLINGSLNWTRQAVVGNRENVLVTNNADVVRQYLEEFEQLWKLYDPRSRKFKDTADI